MIFASDVGHVGRTSFKLLKFIHSPVQRFMTFLAALASGSRRTPFVYVGEEGGEHGRVATSGEACQHLLSEALGSQTPLLFLEAILKDVSFMGELVDGCLQASHKFISLSMATTSLRVPHNMAKQP